MSYELKYGETGKLEGVLFDGASFIPKNPSNSDWKTFLTWNANQLLPWDLSDKVVIPENPVDPWDTVRVKRRLGEKYKEEDITAVLDRLIGV